MIQEIIDNLLSMLLFIFFGYLVFRFGLKKSFKNNVGLFYEKGLILFITCIIASLISFIKIIFSLIEL
jgi:hypothetical protein